MVEGMGNPALPPHSYALAAGQEVDWKEVFTGYSLQVDFSGAAVWHRLSIAFPDAKVIHTESPEDDWWASYSKTIGKFFALRPNMPLPPPVASVFKTMDKLLIQDAFGGLGRESSIAAYRANNAKVRATVPADRLLVFTPADGWGPLCGFLGVALPDAPFPKTHARDEFWAHFGGEPADAVA